jgi:hypothetical protein
VTGAPSPRHSHLRLVEKRPLAPRLEVRIHVLDRRAPYGRAGPFRLAENDLWKLVEIATRLEAARR